MENTEKKIYSRTTTIQEDKVSGFCPGCMHSTVVKLIGEVLDELNVVDKAVMITGIGCCGLHMDFILHIRVMVTLHLSVLQNLFQQQTVVKTLLLFSSITVFMV